MECYISIFINWYNLKVLSLEGENFFQVYVKKLFNIFLMLFIYFKIIIIFEVKRIV